MASSEYLQREEAAKKQLGKKGVAKRAKQLPRAARATARGLLREVTGVDVSRKGVSVSPESLAMALPLGKVLKAARVLRTAGNIKRAAALESRAAAKLGGQMGARTSSGLYAPAGQLARETSRKASESVFPRLTYGTMESIPNLTKASAKSASKSMGQAASREISTGRALRGVPGERERSMRNFAEARVNIRSAKELKRAAKNNGGR